MDKLLALYQKLNNAGAKFYNWDLKGGVAVTIESNGRYGIFIDDNEINNSAEETVVVAHEGGHFSTGATHKVCSPYDLIEKHEYKAWKWAVEHCISAEELDDAVAEGYSEIWSLAEHFNVTEDFMRKVVCWYTHGNLDVEHYMSY